MNPRPSPASGGTTVAPAFVTGMLAGMARLGLDSAPALAAAGIDLAEPARRIPIARYAALYNLLNRQLDDEGFALFARPLPRGSFEFLCRGMVGAPTLAVALERASRFLRIVLPDLAVDVTPGGEMAEIRLSETRRLAEDANDPGRVFAFEWLLRLLHGLSCWLVGRGLALDHVVFPYDRPAHADDYRLIYSEQFTFAGSCLRARLNPKLLDLPIRRDEAALAAFLDGAPGKLTTLYRRDRAMVIRVRDLLRAALPRALDLDDIADRLHLSPRTVHRRLADEGASFRAIKDALRRDLALARLRQGSDAIAQVAADLGYADSSAFYRAVVAWTGLAPARYRRQGLDKS